MANEAISCTIQGTSPLLMHRYPLMPPAKGWEKWTPEKQAEVGEYRDPDSGELYIPGLSIQRCLVSAATFSKGKGRATLQKPVAACVLITPERCLLGTKTFEVDSRAVVIQKSGRIVRHRPRINEWKASFLAEYDTELISATELRQVVDDAGKRVGLMDFRPECKGSFGRFMVVEWK